jgi:ribonuclease P protein component
MNIKRYFILGTNEIRYITNTKNKKFLRWKILNINIINQYDNRHYNKFAISISSKFHKKAVYRNIVRRIFFDIIYKNDLVNKKILWWYKKIYVSLKKWVEYDVKWEKFKEQVRKDLEKDLKLLKFG